MIPNLQLTIQTVKHHTVTEHALVADHTTFCVAMIAKQQGRIHSVQNLIHQTFVLNVTLDMNWTLITYVNKVLLAVEVMKLMLQRV